MVALPFHFRALTGGRQGDLLGGRGPGGVPASFLANNRPSTATGGPSNDTTDANDTADAGSAGGRGEREGRGSGGGGGEEEEPNCPVQ